MQAEVLKRLRCANASMFSTKASADGSQPMEDRVRASSVVAEGLLGIPIDYGLSRPKPPVRYSYTSPTSSTWKLLHSSVKTIYSLLEHHMQSIGHIDQRVVRPGVFIDRPIRRVNGSANSSLRADHVSPPQSLDRSQIHLLTLSTRITPLGRSSTTILS